MVILYKAIATIGVCACAVYGELNGIRYLFIGAVIICVTIW